MAVCDGDRTGDGGNIAVHLENSEEELNCFERKCARSPRGWSILIWSI